MVEYADLVSAIRGTKATERARAVAWLREHGNHDPDQFGICRRCEAAEEIENGQHDKRGGD